MNMPAEQDLGATSHSLRILDRGKIAIIQSSTEAVHWPQLETRAYTRIRDRLPWLDVEFFDESTIEDVFISLEKDTVTAVIVSAGAMASAQIRHQLSQNADILRTSIRRGLGIAIAAPFVTDEDIFDLDFIPSPTPVAIARLLATRNIEGRLDIFGRGGAEVSGARSPLFRYASTCTARNAPGWTRSVACTNPVTGEVLELAWQSRIGAGFAFVTILPLERLEQTDAFDQLIGRLTWSRGRVSIGDFTDTSPAPSSAHPAAFEVTAQTWDAVEGYEEHFGHLRIMTLDRVPDDPPYQTHEVLKRSERAGSIEILLPSLLERPSLVRFGGTPEYLKLLRAAELKAVDSLLGLSAGPTFDLVAYNLCAAEARRAVTNGESLPRMFSASTSAALSQEALRLRLRDGAVDGNILATSNALASATLAGIDTAQTTSARKWLTAAIQNHHDRHEVAQTYWVARAAELDWLTELTEDSLAKNDEDPVSFPTLIGQLTRDLRAGEWTERTEDDLLKDSHLEAAVNAYTFLLGAHRQYWDFQHTPQYLVNSNNSGATEANFYNLAAGILADKFSPLSTSSIMEPDADPIAPEERERASIHAVTALRHQAEAELERNAAIELREENSSILVLTRRLLGLLTFLWILGISAATYAIVNSVFPDAALGDWLAAFGLGALVIATGIGIAANSPRISHALPGWSRWLIRFSGREG